MDLLRAFTGDVNTKEALKDFIFDVINREALLKMYAKEDVTHIADAKELIDKAFEELDEVYGLKEKQNVASNQAK